jgi:cobalt/nickel transport system ATP-binding protein
MPSSAINQSGSEVAASEFAFDVRAVSYAYHGIAALDAVSLQIGRGERVALLGANGSGKSTVLRLLAALAFPQRGEITFFAEPLSEARLEEAEFFYRFRRRVGVVFQNPDVQLFNPSVFDEVAFGPLQLRWPKEEIRRKVEQTLESMGIAELRERAPHRLSGGEKKRVALASVLVLDPEVLILDEPAAALDPKSQIQIVELLNSWKNGRRTVVIATHDLDTLEQTADRCYVLKEGRVAGVGDPLAILHDVALLEDSGLIRPQQHVHAPGTPPAHPHLHRHDISS